MIRMPIFELRLAITEKYFTITDARREKKFNKAVAEMQKKQAQTAIVTQFTKI